MSITIVMGPACAGKSHFIQTNYPNATVIDLYDFQKRGFSCVEDVWKSYEACADALKKAIKEKENNKIILEHTLLKRIRREWYISQIREVTDEDIDIICIAPSTTTLCERAKKRKIDIDTSDAEETLSILELPTVDEGYANVTILTP